MPKRTRSHILEAASVKAFEQLLPENWVYRTVPLDYGIDAEIEIFNTDGSSTAVKFLVQLKATDEKNLDKALSVRLPVDRCDYYYQHDLPILIVRYHAPTDIVYTKWFHSFDPYDCRKDGAKTANLKLSPKDVWNDETPTNLSEEIAVFRTVRSPSIPTPITFDLIVAEDTRGDYSSFRLKSFLKQKADEIREFIIFNICNPHSKATNVLEISSEKISVRLAGQNAITIHTPEGYPPDRFAEAIYNDILVLLGLGLHAHGHSNVGAIILAEYASKSPLTHNPRFAGAVADCLSAAGDFLSMMEMAETMLFDMETANAGQVLLSSVLLANRDRLTPRNKDRIYAIMARIAVTTENEMHEQSAAMHYNCGNFLGEYNNNRLAFSHYRKAQKLWPPYQQRGYFWFELGGCLFRSQRYSLAERAYRCAINLSPKKPYQPFLADSLLFQGKLSEALTTFESYLHGKTQTVPDCEWALKAFAIENIIQFLDWKSHERDPEASFAIFRGDKTITEESCFSAVKLDPLNALAWYNLGQLTYKNEPQLGLLSFLWAALLVPNDLAAWQNVLALSRDLQTVFAPAIYLVFSHNGQEAVRFFQENSPDKNDLEFASSYEEFFQEMTSLIPSANPKTIRFGNIEHSFDLFAVVDADIAKQEDTSTSK